MTDKEEVIERIGNAQIVFTNKTPISSEVLDRCPQIKYIGVLATGYNVVDVRKAEEKGIVVTNIPTYGTDAVGQFAIALLLEICHHIGHHNKVVHEGRWEKSQDWCFWDYPLIELSGKTIGIIGFGRIGRTTGRIAQALGMKVLAYDSYQDPALESKTCKYASMDTLLSESDVIALHCPLFPETEGIINKNTIKRMKDGVIIINNSRGSLIIEQDLADALNSGKVAAAALDVVSSEPIHGDNPLLKAKNCIITPHISWAPRESRQRLMDIAADNLEAFLSGQDKLYPAGSVPVSRKTHAPSVSRDDLRYDAESHDVKAAVFLCPSLQYICHFFRYPGTGIGKTPDHIPDVIKQMDSDPAAVRVVADAVADHISQRAFHQTGIAGQAYLFRVFCNSYINLITFLHYNNPLRSRGGAQPGGSFPYGEAAHCIPAWKSGSGPG